VLAKWQANRAIGYVDAHLDARLKVSEIAQVVHLSSSHFSRAFKRTFGMTVHAWVMRRRIEVAQGMMLNTPHKLSEIALRCGLSDQSHLTRWFRRVVGETPGTWRRGGALATPARSA
jgi:AraC-like DNA-binding protein